MADPRGISTAVFEPTPMRDFTKDIALGRQMKAAAQEAENTAYDSYLEQYGVELPKDVPYPYQDAVNALLENYKNEASRVYSLRGTPEYAKELAKLKNTQQGVRSAISGAKYKFATAEAAEKFAQKYSDKLGEEGLMDVVSYADEGYNPTQSFKIDETDGTVYWGDKPAGEAFRGITFQPPVEAPKPPFDRMVSRDEVDVNNWGQYNQDGSYTFSPSKALRFFNIEKGRASNEYLDYVRDVVGRKDLTNEEAIAVAESDPSISQDIEKMFLEEAQSRFKEGRGYKDEGDITFNSGNYNKSKGAFFSDAQGEGITFGGSPIKLSMVKNGSSLDFTVTDIIDRGDGQYIARGYYIDEDDNRIRKEEPITRQIASQVESNLKIDNFFDWFEAKKALKSGQQPTEQPVKVEETEEIDYSNL